VNTRLRSTRREKGVSLKKLSEMTGIGLSTIGNYETGKYPISQEFLSRIAATLDVTVDYLLGRTLSEKTLNISEGRASTAGNGEAACRYPADCDLPGRLDRLEKNLADINTLLVSLLAEERSRNAPAAAGPTEKAG